MAKKKKQNWRENKKVMYAYIAFFIIASIYVLILTVNSFVYENRIYPGISVGGISLGGKTKEEAKKILSEKANPPVKIVLKGKKDYEIGSDLAISFDIDKSVENAYQVGRDDNLNPIRNYQTNLPLGVDLNEDLLSGALTDIAFNQNEKVEDASIYMQNGQVKANKESIGERVLLGENIDMIKNGLGNMQSTFDLKVKIVEPQVTEKEITLAESEVKEILSKKLVLHDGNNKIVVSSSDLADFINFQRGMSNASLVRKFQIADVFPFAQDDSIISTGFDQAKIRDFSVRLSSEVNQDARNAKLDANNGKVEVVADSVLGKKVRVDELASRIKDALENGQANVDIPIDTTKPEVSSDNLDKLGLKELVATGWTDFSGSPHNREINIGVGASKFNGVLIKPGENFSFDETLGPVDASTGYLPELVIKENKTIPDYGGGLCQVSSTAFRAALNAGLPILQRYAHAYPVGYYKPYGVDATIYLPSPDLIFKNDTQGYILIQTRINGKHLSFDFYGTKKPGSIKFAGNEQGTVGASDTVEGIDPTISEKDARGPGSFTAIFYRLMYDASGKLEKTNYWISKYDTPTKYPH